MNIDIDDLKSFFNANRVEYENKRGIFKQKSSDKTWAGIYVRVYKLDYECACTEWSLEYRNYSARIPI